MNMTQEEKAKAYDEALEKAKELLDSPRTCFDIVQLKDIFPELRESEDERIRKWLYNYIYNCPNENFEFYGGVRKDAVLAYLEKQKEWIASSIKTSASEDEEIRKEIISALKFANDDGVYDKHITYLEKQKEPLSIPDKFSGLKSLMLQYLQSAANRKDDVEIESDTDLWGRKILDYVWKYSDEQKERETEVNCYGPRDTWEYVDEFIKKFGRIPKDVDELSACVDYVIEHKSIDEKEQKKSLSEKFRPDFPTVADFIESVDAMEKNRAIEILEDYLKWAVSSEEECPYTWKELANAIQLGIDAMKEQKPAEWSEEDETRLTNILIMLKEYVIHHYSKDDVNKSVDWLENRVKFLRPQPKQEWSKEDESMHTRCCGIFGKCAIGELPLSVTEELDWLKSLPERFNLQPKQEWSEEDEMAYGDLIWCIKQARKSAKDENDMGNIWFAENWLKNRLKSLRPQSKQAISEDTEVLMAKLVNLLKSYRIGEETATTLANRIANTYGVQRYMDGLCDSEKSHWKPTEEQMDALEEVIILLHNLRRNTDDRKNLEALREQLKKLRVEKEPKYYQHFDPDC